jgi:hypothetical protein
VQIKGTALIGRETFITKRFGAAAWRALIQAFRTQDPSFPTTVKPTALIPAEAFLRFNDLIIDRHFGGNPEAYWEFGAESAEWALTEGPYSLFVGSRDLRDFAATLPTIWSMYYTEGHIDLAPPTGDVVELKVTGVTTRHVYFEYTAMGYIERGLELASGRSVASERLAGFSRGDADIHYRFTVRA